MTNLEGARALMRACSDEGYNDQLPFVMTPAGHRALLIEMGFAEDDVLEQLYDHNVQIEEFLMYDLQMGPFGIDKEGQVIYDTERT